MKIIKKVEEPAPPSGHLWVEDRDLKGLAGRLWFCRECGAEFFLTEDGGERMWGGDGSCDREVDSGKDE